MVKSGDYSPLSVGTESQRSSLPPLAVPKTNLEKMTLVALLASQRALFVRHKQGILLLAYSICFVVYLSAGGFFFVLIEGPEIEKSQRDVLDVKDKILKKFPNVPGEALDAYLNELRSLGVRGLPDPKGTVTRWTFADAVFFTTTLLTTIGYGHVTPRTFLGKIICMLYTGLGIPVTLLLLASYVDRLMRLSEHYKSMLFKKLQSTMEPFLIRLTHITSIMVLILLLCFILPAIIFSRFEKDWGIFDGIYYCFISLTTVGLGDLVPALDPDISNPELYKYGATFFMLAGVTIMMFMMAMSADFHQNYNCCYDSIPYASISTEKISINPSSTHTYGSILTQSGKSEDGKISGIVISP